MDFDLSEDQQQIDRDRPAYGPWGVGQGGFERAEEIQNGGEYTAQDDGQSRRLRVQGQSQEGDAEGQGEPLGVAPLTVADEDAVQEDGRRPEPRDPEETAQLRRRLPVGEIDETEEQDSHRMPALLPTHGHERHDGRERASDAAREEHREIVKLQRESPQHENHEGSSDRISG